MLGKEGDDHGSSTKHGKWGLLRLPIRLHGEQSDPRCNFYLELAADKENPGAKRRGGGEGNSLFPGRWTLSGALRIIFTCGHRCFVDGRIHALIKLMQPNLCVCPPTELCLHTACLGAACPCHAHSCLRVVCGDGRGKGGRVTFMERYTLSKRVGMRAEPEEFSSRVLTSTFLPDWPGEKWSIWETAFSIRPPPPGKHKYFPRLFGYRAADFSTTTFVIHFSTDDKNS